MSILDGVRLNNNISLEQDDVDAPDTLHIVIRNGKDKLRMILTVDPHVIATEKNTIDKKVYDISKDQNIEHLRNIQNALSDYMDEYPKQRSDMLKALAKFPMLTSHIKTSKIALATTLSMEDIHTHMSIHLEKMDTYIAELKLLQAARSTQHINYNTISHTYKKLKSQYKAASELNTKPRDKATPYWEQLAVLYRDNLSSLVQLDKEEKKIQDSIDKLYQEIEQIRRDQSFIAEFDSLLAEAGSDKAEHKLLMKKQDIELTYKGEFAQRIQSAEDRIVLRKSDELPFLREMRVVIIEQQEDYINQLVVLHKPAEQIHNNIQNYTRNLESQNIEHKKSQRETNKYARQIDAFRYTNKILDLMHYEKAFIDTKTISLNGGSITKILYILEEFAKIPSEYTSLLSIKERSIYYRRLLDKSKNAKNSQTPAAISNNGRNKLSFLIDKDFVSISQRKPRLYEAKEQMHQSDKQILSLQKDLSGIDKGFKGTDKNSDAHKHARKPYTDQIDIHEKLIKQMKNEMKLMLQKIIRDYDNADHRTKELLKNITKYEQLILSSRKQLQSMLASDRVTQKSTPHVDIHSLTQKLSKEEIALQAATQEKTTATDNRYTHILHIHDTILLDAENYIQKIISSIENFESKPTSGVAKELRMTGGDKVFLQRSYTLLDAFIERFESLYKLTELTLSPPSDLQQDENIKGLKLDIKNTLKNITPYRKS